MDRRTMNRRVLVVDDERSVRDAFAGALADLGYEVETAVDGVDGLARAQAQPPDLIFLDLRMPRMDGIALVRHLQAPGGCCAQVPIYIVTAFQREFLDSLKKALAEGFRFDVADKPLTPAQIQTIARSKFEGAIKG